MTANTGNVNSEGVRDALESLIDEQRHLRLIIWNDRRYYGSDGAFQIHGFGLFKLVGFRLGSRSSWILLEFVGIDESCNQYPPATNTPTPTATNTPVPTNTPTSTATNTPMPTATNTPTPTATATPPPNSSGSDYIIYLPIIMD